MTMTFQARTREAIETVCGLISGIKVSSTIARIMSGCRRARPDSNRRGSPPRSVTKAAQPSAWTGIFLNETGYLADLRRSEGHRSRRRRVRQPAMKDFYRHDGQSGRAHRFTPRPTPSF